MHEDIDPHDIDPQDWLIDWQHAKHGSPKILINTGKHFDEDDNLIGLHFKELPPSLRTHALALEAITDYDFFTHQQPMYNDGGTAVVEVGRRRNQPVATTLSSTQTHQS